MSGLVYFNAEVKSVNKDLIVLTNNESVRAAGKSARAVLPNIKAGQKIRIGHHVENKREALWLGQPLTEKVTEAAAQDGSVILPPSPPQGSLEKQAREIAAGPATLATESDMMAWGAAMKSMGQVFQGTGNIEGMLAGVEAAMKQRKAMQITVA